jgi:hypothetical protein
MFLEIEKLQTIARSQLSSQSFENQLTYISELKIPIFFYLYLT